MSHMWILVDLLFFSLKCENAHKKTTDNRDQKQFLMNLSNTVKYCKSFYDGKVKILLVTSKKKSYN
jgi:hypothetical protein